MRKVSVAMGPHGPCAMAPRCGRAVAVGPHGPRAMAARYGRAAAVHPHNRCAMVARCERAVAVDPYDPCRHGGTMWASCSRSGIRLLVKLIGQLAHYAHLCPIARSTDLAELICGAPPGCCFYTTKTLASTFPKDTSRHLCLPSGELVFRQRNSTNACLPHQLSDHSHYRTSLQCSFVLQFQVFHGAPLPRLSRVHASS